MLPTFRTEAAEPGSRRLHAGHRLARKADTRQTHPGLTYYTPVLMSPYRVTHITSDPQQGMRTVFLIPT